MDTLNFLAHGWLPLFMTHMLESSLFITLIYAADRIFVLDTRRRYTIWLLGLVKLFLPPVITVGMPEVVPVPVQQLLPAVLLPAVSSQPGHVTNLTPAGLLFILWSIMVLATVAVILYKNCQLNQRLADSRPVDQNAIISSTMHLPAKLQIFLTSALSTPLVKGILRPRLYVPREHLRLPQQQRHSILAHELAHLNSFDIPALYLQALAISVFGSNPMVWLLHRRLVYLRELRCDETAMAQTGINPVEYSKVLYGFLENQNMAGCPLHAGVPFAENKDSVFKRFEHILNSSGVGAQASRLSRAVPFAFALLLLPFSLHCDGSLLSPGSEQRGPTMAQPPGKSAGTTFVAYDEAPQPIGGIKAIQDNLIYPEAAREAGISGRAIVNVRVDQNGNVLESRILKSTGNEELDQAARDALRTVEWRPARHNGKPVTVWVGFPVIFTLD